MSIPVKAEPIEYLGRIETIEEIEGTYGEQIRVNLKPCNPDAINFKPFFFPKSASSRGKWMKFVVSFDKANKKEIASADEMIGRWVRIQEVLRSGEVQGEAREWVEPLVAEVYPDEAIAMTAWQAKQHSLIEKVTPVPFDEPKPTIVPVPEAIAVVLKSMLAGEKGDKEKLWEKAQSMGFTKMQVFAAVD